MGLEEKKMTRREFIQYLYEEKLKEELKNTPLKRLVLKDRVIWYAEPGNAKAVDSFDHRCYEMVRVPRFASVLLLLFCPPLLILLSSSFAIEPPSSRISTTQQSPHIILPGYMKSDGQRLGRIGYINHPRALESVETVSWN